MSMPRSTGRYGRGWTGAAGSAAMVSAAPSACSGARPPWWARPPALDGPARQLSRAEDGLPSDQARVLVGADEPAGVGREPGEARSGQGRERDDRVGLEQTAFVGDQDALEHLTSVGLTDELDVRPHEQASHGVGRGAPEEVQR